MGVGGMVIKQLSKGWPLSPWIKRLAEFLLKVLICIGLKHNELISIQG
jgi:hypothetical protein